MNFKKEMKLLYLKYSPFLDALLSSLSMQAGQITFLFLFKILLVLRNKHKFIYKKSDPHIMMIKSK